VGFLLPVVLVILEIDEYLSRVIERADYSIMGTITIEVSDRVVLDVVTFARLLRQTDIMFGPSCAATTKFFRSARLLRSYALVPFRSFALVLLSPCVLFAAIVETTYFCPVCRYFPQISSDSVPGLTITTYGRNYFAEGPEDFHLVICAVARFSEHY
jgi:hypothetical protein